SAPAEPRTSNAGGRRPAARGTSSGPSRRGLLGVDLVEVPSIPLRDPAEAILRDPKVPENKRYCSNGECGEQVGRGRGGKASRTEGFCRSCGTWFSFTPKLRRGDVVEGQYEVFGCLAHGGLGWVYLARDLSLDNRWVVLKGLLDTGDTEALAAAGAERAFLAQVRHPNIVTIYNFAKSDSGYLVMEYLGGRSLKEILLARRKDTGGAESLPVGQAIAYCLEVLSALGYLHDQGLLYCDFKPDNAIQSEEQLKLIDLGGVRRMDDADSPIYGTVGYQAPEIGTEGPSISSDLYTVGRTLAVLTFSFKGYTTIHAHDLPAREDVPLLLRHESYDRLLRRATHWEPARRFQSATEMSEQLAGVLREVLSAEDGRPRPAPSTLFGPETYAAGTDLGPLGDAGPMLPPLDPPAAAAALPIPLVNGSDPAAGVLAGLTARDPADVAAVLTAMPVTSLEVTLTLARVRIELGSLAEAGVLLSDALATSPGDWRVDWYRGVAALAGEQYAEAVQSFDDLYGRLPGEAAPRLALAFSLECDGRPRQAARHYESVWRTDRSYVSAAFGLARVRLAEGDRRGAMEALCSVPRLSSHHVTAQIAAITTAVRGRYPAGLTAADLTSAAARLDTLRLDAGRRRELIAQILEAALACVLSAHGPLPATTLLGAPLTEDAVRRSLERTYRDLARHADSTADRHALVLRANAARPKTWF
ncbi:serine/threonine-protein kinase, partial [Actinomadura sp. HBU206391]|uniref:serine/threonine-protein kinase n=1 Tax=Actinomadura sp. HBU206391 TaxID=2731692 RepID=UPI002905B5A8